MVRTRECSERVCGQTEFGERVGGERVGEPGKGVVTRVVEARSSLRLDVFINLCISLVLCIHEQRGALCPYIHEQRGALILPEFTNDESGDTPWCMADVTV